MGRDRKVGCGGGGVSGVVWSDSEVRVTGLVMRMSGSGDGTCKQYILGTFKLIQVRYKHIHKTRED